MLHEIARRIAERLRVYHEINRLRRLDDGLLADMGIERREIAARVRGDLF